jgi:hypothetical protein
MRLVRVTVAAAATATVLVGCSDGGTANETLPPTSTSAAKPTSTYGPSDLPMPASAQEESPEGFSSFVEYYVSLVNRLQTDLDSTYLRQFSRNCETCDRLASDADSDAKQGYHYAGGTITISAMGAAALTSSQAEVAFTVDQAAYSVLDASNQQVQGLAGNAATGLPAGMIGVWAGDHWVATTLSFG